MKLEEKDEWSHMTVKISRIEAMAIYLALGNMGLHEYAASLGNNKDVKSDEDTLHDVGGSAYIFLKDQLGY